MVWLALKNSLLKEFPIIKDCVYLNTASIGLTPKSVISYVKEFLDDILSWGTVHFDEEKEAMVFEDLRRVSSKLFNCSFDEIAVFTSVTEAINSIAWALNFKNCKIVSTEVEFPTVVYPWIRISKEKNWNVVLVKARNYLINEEVLLSEIDENTKVVCLSHVEYLTGQRFNLKRIAEKTHNVDALLIVDGIQAAGHIPVDVKKLDVDVYVTGSYKWLIGPMGAAGSLHTQRALRTIRTWNCRLAFCRRHLVFKHHVAKVC